MVERPLIGVARRKHFSEVHSSAAIAQQEVLCSLDENITR